jgi:hypothetical protein
MPIASGRIIFFVFLESKWMAVIIFLEAGRQEMKSNHVSWFFLLIAATTGTVC